MPLASSVMVRKSLCWRDELAQCVGAQWVKHEVCISILSADVKAKHGGASL